MKNKTREIVLIVIAGVLLAFFPLTVAAEDKVSITDQLRRAGATVCLSTVQILEHHFLGLNVQDSGHIVRWSRGNMGAQTVNVTMELTHRRSVPLVTSSIVDFTVIPESNGTCSAVYTQSFYTSDTCFRYRNNFYPEAKRREDLSRSGGVLRYNLSDSNPLEILSASPVGEGCLFQVRETLFNFRLQDKD